MKENKLEKNSLEDKKFRRRSKIANLMLAGTRTVYLSSFFYVVGSINPSKWPEIQRGQEIQEELKIQDQYRQEFYDLDKNKDYKIDSTEFIYGRK